MPSKPPVHFVDLDVDERRAAITELGMPGFRADQVSRHIFARHSEDVDEWSDISASDRTAIKAALMPELLTQVRTQVADDGETVKSLWSAHDGVLFESVLMRYPERVTMCVSSQAGCGMNCPFCATGQGGLKRNLSTAEITEQVLAGVRSLGDDGRVSNVVFMGMGEPLANYDAVIRSLHRLIDPPPAGLGLSARHVTVSTVGLVPRILELAEEGLPVTLALSLHAPDDELRDTLVPINNRWKVAEVLEAANTYAVRTGRRVSIEYALIKDINDQPWRADLLGELLAGKLMHVNLIPLNPTPGSIWTASTKAAQREFVARLERQGVPVSVRDTRGRDIDGACGQLAGSSATSESGSSATEESVER